MSLSDLTVTLTFFNIKILPQMEFLFVLNNSIDYTMP